MTEADIIQILDVLLTDEELIRKFTEFRYDRSVGDTQV